MSSLFKNPVARRLLRPATTLVDQRVQRPVSRLRKDIDKVAHGDREARESLRKELDSLRKELGGVRKEMGSLRDEVSGLRGKQYAYDLIFERVGRAGHRAPTKEQFEKLVDEIAEVSGQDRRFARRNATAAFRNVVALEALGVGRVAGTNSNVCGKLATVPLLDPPNGDVLEIGTLFGLFSATFMRMLHRAGIEPRLTIVDPLAGSQLQPGTNFGSEPTGTPVRLDVVRANLALGGTAGELARIQQGFSGDEEVREAVSDRQYGVIIIDGDHSEEGVAADLEWAEQIAAPGGIVVLDDYGDPGWEGVQAAGDKHLAGTTRFDLVGRVATSAFLRARD
ncbi:Methyltransferase domain-containing protein [Streptomyces sp. DvalAA-14]|uniref:class I SAM-dependent methyltransferase n=1 Tax=unclassified Streptomyces TaxID=2593676 RepID=UPI00081B08B9|nr:MULTISPECIES: class I SAM-dependent methyltransferase [unclassified Streptomyces]MYS23290.1 class I SAM-dependent methyltransferase [Streptomyces sp. SID4948]SCE30947.1 Methyltransferase domain-containing protein [Streptomyces sp. DvalAA-14]